MLSQHDNDTAVSLLFCFHLFPSTSRHARSKKGLRSSSFAHGYTCVASCQLVKQPHSNHKSNRATAKHRQVVLPDPLWLSPRSLPALCVPRLTSVSLHFCSCTMTMRLVWLAGACLHAGRSAPNMFVLTLAWVAATVQHPVLAASHREQQGRTASQPAVRLNQLEA